MRAERVALRFAKITFGVIHSTAATTQEHLLRAPRRFWRGRARYLLIVVSHILRIVLIKFKFILMSERPRGSS